MAGELGAEEERTEDMTNLNEVSIQTDGYPRTQEDNSTDSGTTRVFFKNLAANLVNLICRPEVEVVVGCVAWLRHPEILDAISRRPASIVVQKEDFLRPDGASTDKRLREQYKAIGGLDRRQCDPVLSSMNVAGDPGLDGVRCVGVVSGRGTSPKMHHKFLVFCRFTSHLPGEEDEDTPPEGLVEPFAVWTGSFNFTYNATQLFENAIYIEDKKIARAYFDEFQQVAALSEPLDWNSEYVEPEWRIGT